MSSNILSAPAYGIHVSQLVRYARACCNYEGFVDRGKLLTSKLLSQGYRRAKCQLLKGSMGSIMILLIPTAWPRLNL